MKKQIAALTAIAALSIGAASQASAAETHTVEKGDTLWSISQNNNVTVEDIKDWNDLQSDIIIPNQVLRVDDQIETYVVEKGDTLFKIATNYGVTVDQLMNWNSLSGDLIHPGDELTIGGALPEQAAAPAQAKSQAKATSSASTHAKKEVKAASTSKSNVAATLTVSATAYTADCAGCSGVTATGINLKQNPNMKVIAVDPSVIPLGSRVWVEGYGEAIAGDTGGAIKGNKIDIFMPNKSDAFNWGVRTVNVKILN